MRTTAFAARTTVFVLALSTLAACGGGANDESASDTAAATSTAAAATDTAGGSMDHSNMPGMNMPPARDADQEFLRMMTDHHEGLIKMMDPAMEKASTSTAKADAKKLHDKQHEEQEQLIGMLKSSYDETKQPMVMPSSQQMVDDLANTSAGPAYDKKMYGHVIMHHQEGIKMMNDFQPRLTKPELKQMVEKMKADQQKEIEEFRRKSA